MHSNNQNESIIQNQVKSLQKKTIFFTLFNVQCLIFIQWWIQCILLSLNSFFFVQFIFLCTLLSVERISVPENIVKHTVNCCCYCYFFSSREQQTHQPTKKETFKKTKVNRKLKHKSILGFCFARNVWLACTFYCMWNCGFFLKLKSMAWQKAIGCVCGCVLVVGTLYLYVAYIVIQIVIWFYCCCCRLLLCLFRM